MSASIKGETKGLFTKQVLLWLLFAVWLTYSMGMLAVLLNEAGLANICFAPR